MSDTYWVFKSTISTIGYRHCDIHCITLSILLPWVFRAQKTHHRVDKWHIGGNRIRNAADPRSIIVPRSLSTLLWRECSFSAKFCDLPLVFYDLWNYQNIHEKTAPCCRRYFLNMRRVINGHALIYYPLKNDIASVPSLILTLSFLCVVLQNEARLIYFFSSTGEKNSGKGQKSQNCRNTRRSNKGHHNQAILSGQAARVKMTGNPMEPQTAE